MRRLLAFALVPTTLACDAAATLTEDASPDLPDAAMPDAAVGDHVTVTVKTTPPGAGRAELLGWRDGLGGWTALDPNGVPNAIAVTASYYSVAYHCAGWTTVITLTREDLDALDVACASGLAKGTLTGTASGLSSTAGSYGLVGAARWFDALPDPVATQSLQLEAPGGTYDLIAGRFPGGGLATHVILERGVTIVAGQQTVRDLDFAAQGIMLEARAAPAGFSATRLGSVFQTAGGSYLGFGLDQTAPLEWRALPAASLGPGDRYVLNAVSADSRRITLASVGSDPGVIDWSFPAALNGVAVVAVETQPTTRLAATFPASSTAALHQLDLVGETANQPGFTIARSSTARAAGAALEVPDLSGLPAWSTAYALPPGVIEWTASARDSTAPLVSLLPSWGDTRPLPLGTLQRMATESGSYEP